MKCDDKCETCLNNPLECLICSEKAKRKDNPPFCD
jgi:hypothetical protein